MWTYLHGKGGAQGEGRGEKQWGYPESFQEFSITLADTTEAHQPPRKDRVHALQSFDWG